MYILSTLVLCLFILNIIVLCWMWVEDYYEGLGLGAPRFCFSLYDGYGLRLWVVVIVMAFILPAIIIDTIIFLVVALFKSTNIHKLFFYD